MTDGATAKTEHYVTAGSLDLAGGALFVTRDFSNSGAVTATPPRSP
jgi:hypothetical protein